MNDRLASIFLRQRGFMDLLREHDRFPEYPVDMTTKPGQRFVGECSFNLIKELMEANVVLKNKMHRISDVEEFDRQHFVEEMGDTFAFFVELCLIADISEDELYGEYCRKNAIVRKRVEEGY